ncbi:MAG: nitroreductase family protein [Alphaproteobacteria bacterium]
MTQAGEIRDSVQARFGADPGISTEGVDVAGLARLLDRRSCRDYAERDVPEGLVRLVLAAGLSAPTKSDLQQADVVWVRDAALRGEVLEGIGGADWIARAPVFLVVCANGARFASLFEGGAFANDRFDALFNATVDAAIVLEGIVAAAALAGLGTCPISQIRNRAERISGLLDLPGRVFPVAGLCMGYPASEAPISPRLDLGITVHEDRYDRDAFARLGPAYDARRIVDAPYRRQRQPERFGIAETYGWREDKRRQYADPQRADFGAFLRGRGFSLK